MQSAVLVVLLLGERERARGAFFRATFVHIRHNRKRAHRHTGTGALVYCDVYVLDEQGFPFISSGPALNTCLAC